MLLLAKPDLSQSDLDVAADLAENGSDRDAKVRKMAMAQFANDLAMGWIRDEGPGFNGIVSTR